MRQYSSIPLVLICLTLGLLSGCASTDTKVNEAIALPFDGQSYLLDTGDFVRVTVYGQDQITGDYNIDSNGNIALPLIQDIKASGLTLSQLKENITEALTPEYLTDPKVSIEILSYRDIYVLGEVRNPGKYAYIPNMTVLQAIAVAGGHTYRAQENWAEITRSGDDALTTFRAETKSFVEPGDTLIVKRRWF